MRNFRLAFMKYLLSCIIFFLVAPSSLRADHYGDRHKCSNRSLKGQYSFSQYGEVIGQGPVADIGVFTADGNGNLTGLEVVHLFDGNVIDLALCDGTYEISDTCVGKVVWESWIGGVCGEGTSIGLRTHSVTIGRREVTLLSTTPGTVVVGVATKR